MDRDDEGPHDASLVAYRFAPGVLVRELPDRTLAHRRSAGPGDGTTIVIEGAGVLLVRLATTAASVTEVASGIVERMGSARSEEAQTFLQGLVDRGVLVRG